MKPITYTIAAAFVLILALAIGWMMASHYHRCPQPIAPDPIEQRRFDSLSTVIADRDTTIKRLELQVTQPIIDEKLEKAMEFVGSADLISKLDTLLARPF